MHVFPEKYISLCWIFKKKRDGSEKVDTAVQAGPSIVT